MHAVSCDAASQALLQAAFGLRPCQRAGNHHLLRLAAFTLRNPVQSCRYVNMEVNGFPLKAFIDSGAQVGRSLGAWGGCSLSVLHGWGAWGGFLRDDNCWRQPDRCRLLCHRAHFDKQLGAALLPACPLLSMV